ncbi:MAG TPA: glycosyltransferase [Acidimicrobiales bacterium]|nr:glycosyltransferase [Acidimicrobiales bacterium]
MTNKTRGQPLTGDVAMAPPSKPVMPGFSGEEAALPAPESKARRRTIHVAAVFALAVSIAYLSWRVGFTFGSLWLAIPLWLLELHAVVGLFLFTFSLWDIDSAVIPPPVLQTDQRIAVLIPTYNEPSEVLLPTVAAAVALEPAHETWVLDDGHRPWVREMATSLGARYLTREKNDHAKAGNLNNALEYIDADLLAILDADHVVMPGFLTNTIGYFNDPKIAVVQTPQDFYNVDSFEHGRNRSWFWRDRRAISFNEQRLFYRAIQPGKNRWGAAFWCGTNAVVRAKALRDVGGVAFETVTEDIHTTIRMHRRGWHTMYHNEVLARGLAARDADQYQSQRLRWGTGAMQLLHTEHPLTGPGLTPTQRIAYAATILGWFDAWRTLGYVLIPFAVIFTGASPIHAGALTFALAFGVTFIVQRVALALLSRGYAPMGLATLFEFIRLQITMTATLSYLRPGERPFQVTAKKGADVRHRNDAPWLLWLLLALTGAAAIWFALSLTGATGVTYSVRWTVYGAAFWATVNAALLIAAIERIRSDRFATDRRTAVRLQIAGDVLVDSLTTHLIDISMGGALVRAEGAIPEGVVHELTFHFEGGSSDALNCIERSRQLVGGGGTVLSLQFADHQDRAISSLAVGLFQGMTLSNDDIANGKHIDREPRGLVKNPYRFSRTSQTGAALTGSTAQ